MSVANEIRAAVAANGSFYEAFARGDLDAMEDLWATTSPVLCTHPGGNTLHGRDAVMESWEKILASPPPVVRSDEQVTIIRGVAFVSCLEHIGDGTLAATNVFVWEDRAWRLVHHQAGAMFQAEAAAPPPSGHLH